VRAIGQFSGSSRPQVPTQWHSPGQGRPLTSREQQLIGHVRFPLLPQKLVGGGYCLGDGRTWHESGVLCSSCWHGWLNPRARYGSGSVPEQRAFRRQPSVAGIGNVSTEHKDQRFASPHGLNVGLSGRGQTARRRGSQRESHSHRALVPGNPLAFRQGRRGRQIAGISC
jgi:hypothetical protein